MANFLADPLVTNVTINEEAIRSLGEVFYNYAYDMPEYEEPAEGEKSNVSIQFTIRFDRKGYRVTTVDELLLHFNSATQVERIIFDLASVKSLQSANREYGSYMNVQFDINENVDHFLMVTSDSETWMTGAIAAVTEVLARHKNKGAIFRSEIVTRLTQITGLFIVFVISIKAAEMIAPKLNTENAFLLSFLFILLTCTFLWAPTVNKLHLIFPRVRFYRPAKDSLHWVYQTLVGAALGAAFVWLTIIIGKYLYDGVLGMFTN